MPHDLHNLIAQLFGKHPSTLIVKMDRVIKILGFLDIGEGILFDEGDT